MLYINYDSAVARVFKIIPILILLMVLYTFDTLLRPVLLGRHLCNAWGENNPGANYVWSMEEVKRVFLDATYIQSNKDNNGAETTVTFES